MREQTDQTRTPYEAVCIEQVLISEMDEIAYVSDPVTYEMLYLNEYGKERLNQSNIAGKKCYEVLQGLDTPCPFCTNKFLTTESFYIWEHKNQFTNRHYLLRDKLIKVNGRLLRLEFAVDITEREIMSQAVQRKLEIEGTLLECLRLLGYEKNFSQAVDMILSRIGNLHNADRAYIFECVGRENGVDLVSNTYEWCAPGIQPQKDLLQDVSMAGFAVWTESFHSRGEIVIPSLEAIKETRPEEYDTLKQQGIASLIAVPLFLGGELSGFIGLDNPVCSWDDFSLLHSLSYFITNEQKKRNLESKLREMSYHDRLTGLRNRNSYMHVLEQLEQTPPASLGVLFADLNGLKAVNDRLGHAMGDEYIKNMSAIFCQQFRKEDIFRIGGDEFVFLCCNISQTFFQERLVALQKEIESVYPHGVSMGYLWADKSIRVMEMVKEADRLMYKAKEEYRLCREGKA